ncbi:MAG: PfkB family carbohydrate kinase [Ignavibacteriaceae bacterium]
MRGSYDELKINGEKLSKAVLKIIKTKGKKLDPSVYCNTNEVTLPYAKIMLEEGYENILNEYSSLLKKAVPGSVEEKKYKANIEWQEIFKHAKWFHWTGITPALGKNLQEILIDACRCAKDVGATISCDLNFRAKLWTEKEAKSVMISLMEYVDVCIANEEDAEKSLGLQRNKSNVEKVEIEIDEYFELAKTLKSKFDFNTVSITLRESYSASRNGWSAILLDDKDCKEPCRSKYYNMNIVDRGDSFASGLIYGLLRKTNTKEALEFAVAASCLKQTIPGDFNLVSVEEVEKLLKGSGSGRVER